jgi:hypothetical protein
MRILTDVYARGDSRRGNHSEIWSAWRFPGKYHSVLHQPLTPTDGPYWLDPMLKGCRECRTLGPCWLSCPSIDACIQHQPRLCRKGVRAVAQ